MIKQIFVAGVLIVLALVSAGCAMLGLPAGNPRGSAEVDVVETANPTDRVEPTAMESPKPDATADASAPDGVPARPGSGATSDPSAHLNDLVEACGTVKQVNGQLVLIEPAGGGEFMLRFSENTRWEDGVSQTIEVGNTITCQVKPEPTLTTPSQGEVFLVTGNEKAK